MNRIYLDHAATTPLLPTAAKAMEPWLVGRFGNASSLHFEGQQAKLALDNAREILANAFGCLFGEITFTSSGTEAANHAIFGAALANESERRRIVVSAIEHHCVLACQPLLERLGFEVAFAPVTRQGEVLLDDCIDEQTLLVCLMHANNELGTIQPVADARRLTSEVGSLLFVDAVQTFGNLPLPDADIVSCSSHKIGGPQGVGALFVRAGTAVSPLIVGGGQEREMRAGTENVAAIVGFGAAVNSQPPDNRSEARQAFLDAIGEDGGMIRSVTSAHTLDGHLHFRTPGIDAEAMLIKLDRLGVSASSGAACSAGSLEPSHVLLACGYSEVEAREGLRFSFGKQTTNQQATEAAARVKQALLEIQSSRKR
ncbi:MAG: cysteine desulfurase family protein [Fimbriimonadaceae bacterium]